MKLLFYNIIIIFFNCTIIFAQNINSLSNKLYFQFGYNRAKYSKSNIHFTNNNLYNFTVYNVIAADRPSFGFKDFKHNFRYLYEPTIPQYVYRFGYFINAKHTKSVEINFDHTKYITKDYQIVKLAGSIGNDNFNKDTILDPNKFLHFEHTNGANFMMINYCYQNKLLKKNNKLNYVLKIGAGIVIPKTDVTLFGNRLDNKFHIAGYIFGTEYGVKYYLSKKIYTEYTNKISYANYTNVLTIAGGKANHSFYAFESIGTLGINFGKKKTQKQ